MSPIGSSGRWYNDPERCARAEFTPRVLTTTTTYVFDSEDIEVLLGTLHTHEFLRTSIAGANNDLDWVATTDQTSTVTVAYAVAGTSTPLSIAVDTSNKTVTVNVATNASGGATSTANDVLAAAKKNPVAGQLLSLCIPSLAAGNDGTGVLAAMTATDLGAWSGSSPTVDVKLETSVDGTNWYQVGAAFSQRTSAVAAAKEGRAFAGAGNQLRWNIALGGTSPVVAVSMTAQDKPEV